jgi:AP-3 complex subunit mu
VLTNTDDSEFTPIPSPSFTVGFGIQNHSLSGLKVDQVKVLGDAMYKPFKGIKGVVKGGRLEVRW